MSTLTIGRTLVPLEHIALVEHFEPTANPRLQTDKQFQSRVVMISRDSVLSEERWQTFAEAHGFRVLPEDALATNPAVQFRVQTFTPKEGFQPKKPYVTRLLWRDLDGNDQSKLLVTAAVSTVALAVKGESEAPAARDNATKRTARRKRTAPVLAKE